MFSAHLLLAAVLSCQVTLLASAQVPTLSIGWVTTGVGLCPALQTLVQNFTEATVTVTCYNTKDAWWKNAFENGAALKAGPDILIWDAAWTSAVIGAGYVTNLPTAVNASSNFLQYKVYGRQNSYSKNNSNWSNYRKRASNYNNNKMYGFGISGDMLVFPYRSDLFNSSGLTTPKSWSDIEAAAKSFFQSSGSVFATGWSASSNDTLMDFTNMMTFLITSTGGMLWTKANLSINGVLNSNATLTSMEMARRLYLLGGSATDTMSTAASRLCQGSSAIGLTWASQWYKLTSSTCPLLANISFFALPNSTIGGSGIGLSSYASNSTLASNFLTWLATMATQRAWAQLGGWTTHKTAIRMPEMSTRSSAIRGLFSSSFRDGQSTLWGIKENMLLAQAQMPILFKGVTGVLTPAAALQQAAVAGDKVVDTAYPCGLYNRTCPTTLVSNSNMGLVIGVVAGCAGLTVVAGLGFIAWYIPHKKKVGKMKNDIELGLKAFTVNIDDIKMGPLLGTGAFAEVFWGTWRGTQVAVKKMRKNKVSSDQMELFDREVDLMKLLRHPNILLWLGFGHTDDQLVMVTEFMANGSLATVLENKAINLTLAMKMEMLHDVVQGMQFLHTFDPVILHRDLKSHNVLIDGKFNCKVADFGLTIFQEGKNTQKSDATMSLFWTAPEVLEGATYQTSADVYSFGIVVWEMITRKQPYDDLNPHFVMLKVVSDALRPTIPEGTPPPLAQLAERCWDQKAANRPDFGEILESWPGMMDLMSAEIRKESSHSNIPPPIGKVSLVFTDIQSSTSLWEWNPEIMKESLELHNAVIRGTYQDFQGYEVKTEGDAFMVAFGDASNAIKFCSEAQARLLVANWNETLLTNEHCQKQTDPDGKVTWNGLRVRMGIHTGNPSCQIDPVACRMDYHGPDANKAARVSAVALGGMITVSKETYEELRSNPEVSAVGCFDEIGSMTLKGMAAAEMIYQFVPDKVKSRTFGGDAGANSSSAHPSAMITFGDLCVTQPDEDPESKGPSWLVPFSEIEVDRTKKMGFGSFGEVFVGKWRHQQVAVKFFLNQKIDQSKVVDFRLQLREIAVLGNLRHPNILLFMCACIEQPNMCIVTEWMEKGSLLKLLQSSEEISFSRSLTFGKSIAQGMAFLHASNIMHRDLKSSNVLINANWEVKLGDFGLSKIKSANAKMTVCGTAAWSAPEVLGSSAYSFMADVYSYGVVLWEILSRSTPFLGKHPLQIPMLVLKGERPAIPEHHKFPPAYVNLMKSCWESNPESRPGFNNILATLTDIVE